METGSRIAAVFLALATLVGCGDRSPQLCTVTGTVTLDGVPLAHGELTFRPAEAGVAPRAATVRDGRYRADLPPGRMVVEVHAAGPATGPPTRDMGPGFEELVPARYRGPESVLTIVVSADGENTCPLVLERAPPSKER